MRASSRAAQMAAIWVVITWMGMAVLPTSAHGQGAGKTVPMGTDTRRQQDTFFTALAQARVPPFAAGKLSDTALIDFGVRHVSDRDQRAAVRMGVSTRQVDDACRQFFGVQPKRHQSTSTYRHAGGHYLVTPATGEAFLFSQVSRLSDRGDGTLVAEVIVYVASSGFTGDVHGTPASWKAAGDDVSQSARMKATIKKISQGKASHYILVDYSKVQ